MMYDKNDPLATFTNSMISLHQSDIAEGPDVDKQCIVKWSRYEQVMIILA